MSDPVKSKDMICLIEGNRTVIGVLVSKSNSNIQVKNPATIHLQPTPDGQIQVQLFPLWFSELLTEAQRKAGTVWNFNPSLCITNADDVVELDERLVSQYNRAFGLIEAAPVNNDKPSGKIIKLFDE